MTISLPPSMSMQMLNFQCVESIPMSEQLRKEPKDEMKRFWEEHSKNATLDEMFLEHNPDEFYKADTQEILSELPTSAVDGKDVIELGAGIGFVSSIAASFIPRCNEVVFVLCEGFLHLHAFSNPI